MIAMLAAGPLAKATAADDDKFKWSTPVAAAADAVYADRIALHGSDEEQRPK